MAFSLHRIVLEHIKPANSQEPHSVRSFCFAGQALFLLALWWESLRAS